MNIIIISGSLRKGSFNTHLANAFAVRAPEVVSAQVLDISDLPLVNEDLELALPQSIQNLHDTISQADGAIFVTPEYNRSYSPVLKNAIDWGSRPDGHNAWDGMPAAVAGATPYNLGTFGAQQHLRQVLMYLNMPTLQQPEFYLEHAAEKFDEQGALTDAHTKEKIDQLWGAFVPWIERTGK
jgi:chromate reductase, NAD(P)H dehydrogenase (quinone)